eukprot:gene7552-59243_t
MEGLTAQERDIFQCVDSDGGGTAFAAFDDDAISQAIRQSVKPAKDGEQASVALDGTMNNRGFFDVLQVIAKKTYVTVEAISQAFRQGAIEELFALCDEDE